MVMPKGYKKTEIGIIPENWEIGTVESFGSIVSGGTPSTTNDLYWNGNIRWCTPTDIKATTTPKISHTQKHITEKGLADSSAVLLPINSIMICTRATIGEIRINGLPMATNQGFKNIIVKNGDYLYLYYILTTKKQKMIKLSYGTTFLELSKKALCTIPIQIPKASEQHAISTALYDIDILIDNLEKLISKKKNIKQGAMQELLTGKRRLPGFDGEWINNTLNSFGSFVRGNAFPLPFQGIKSEKYPFYKVSDFNNLGNKRFLIKANNYISEETARELNCNIIPAGSIVFATIGAAIFLERKKLTTVDCCIDNNTMSFQPHSKSSTKFLWYVFQQIRFSSFVEATALPSLSGKTVGSIIYRFPPTLGEQIAIAEVLSDMDNEIEELEKKLTKYCCLKQGMMSELLSGHIRLTEKEGA